MAAGAGLAAHAVGSGAAAKAPAGQAPSPRGYARWAHGLVHYYDTGSGTPLLLLHQAPMSARQFEAVLTPLAARGIRAIAVDLPGFGCSDPTPSCRQSVTGCRRSSPSWIISVSSAVTSLGTTQVL